MKGGYLVQTPSGIKGRTYHSKGLVNGKVPVYPDEKVYGGRPILCEPKKLKIIGFVE